MKEKNTHCDVCAYEFDITKTEVNEKEIELIRKRGNEKVTVMSFCCPNCGREYVIIVHNKRTKKLMEEFNAFANNPPADITKSDAKLQEFYTQKANLFNKLHAETSMLKHLYLKQTGQI